MTWLVAGAVFLGALALLPLARRALRRSIRRDGRFAGAAMGFSFLFAFLFEPAEAAAIEQIDAKKELGDAERTWSGDKV